MSEPASNGKFTHQDKTPGDPIRSADWNAGMNEILRLESAKVNLKGTQAQTIQGSLTIEDALTIGTSGANPKTKLQVKGDLKVDEQLVWYEASGTFSGIGLQDSTLYFRTWENFAWYKRGSHQKGKLDPGGGTVQMVIKDGNVGIGTTKPGATLDVNGGGNVDGKISLQLGSGNSPGSSGISNQIAFSWNNSGLYRHAIKTRHNGESKNGNAIDFYLWTIGADKEEALGTLHTMSLEAGNVGIGTMSPGEKLEVNGNIKAVNVTVTGALKVGEMNDVFGEINNLKNYLFSQCQTLDAKFATYTKANKNGSATEDFSVKSLTVSGDLRLQDGVAVNKISTASDLGGGSASDLTIPTEKAIKAYADTKANKNGSAAEDFNVKRLTVNTKIDHCAKYFNESKDYAALTIFDDHNEHNGGSSPKETRDILHLVREGVADQSYGNKVSFALGKYEKAGSTESRTQLDIKLTHGFFDDHKAVLSLRSNGYVGIGTTKPNVPLDVWIRNPKGSHQNAETKGTQSPDFKYNELFDDNYPKDYQDLHQGNHFQDKNQGFSAIFWGNIAAKKLHDLSDERIKTDRKLVHTRRALDTIMKLKVYEYRYTEALPFNHPYHNSIGFMAQQVAEHFPLAVSNLGTHTLYNDVKIEGLKAVSYNSIFTEAVAALQELTQIVRRQEAELQALKQNIAYRQLDKNCLELQEVAYQ